MTRWLALGEVSIPLAIWSCETCGTVHTHAGEPGECPLCEVRAALEDSSRLAPRWIPFSVMSSPTAANCVEDVSGWFGGAPVDWNDGWESWLPKLRSRKGSNPSEWPSDLRVQEFPR